MFEMEYQQLAQHLDRLPGGFPATESGVEQRILRRLFTPEQARLAVHLTLISEEAAVIAQRSGQPVETVQAMLAQMAEQGLVYDSVAEGKPPRYMAAQFVVGIWEYQVNKLTPELVQDVDEYFKEMFDFDVWRSTPQLRTIPIGESLPAQANVMPYERAEQLLAAYDHFAVAPCVCRQEQRLVGKGCDKPSETCMMMGSAADFYIRHNMARPINRQEALHILDVANQAGLVLQPGNSQKTSFICACCGDCCGVLRTIKLHPQPATIVSSAYRAVCDEQVCSGCGECLERCQMEAIDFGLGTAKVLVERCIGCGLCVTTCETGAMALVRKADDEQPYVPRNIVESTLRLARQREVLKNPDLVKMAIRSKFDRLRALR